MNGRDWQVGRILGIPIKVHESWFLVFAFVTWSLASGYLPEALPGLSAWRYWTMGSVAALLLFVSVLLHELGHSYVALQYHIPIGQITLFIFGGMAQMHREPPGPRAEFLIAIAGPLVSFLLGGSLVAAVWAVDSTSGIQGLLVLGGLLGAVNLQLGLFNLIPGFPLDGGRVLRAGLWAWSGDFYRATRHASLAGQGFGLLLGLMGAALLASSASGAMPGSLAANGGWIGLIGVFLFLAARSSRNQAAIRASLANVAVGEVMIRHVITVPADLTVNELVTQYFLQYGYHAFPVQENGQVVGVLTAAEVQGLPRPLWAWRRVRDIMRPWSPVLQVTPETPVILALEQMRQTGRNQLGVVQDGHLVGLLTRSALSRFLQLHDHR